MGKIKRCRMTPIQAQMLVDILFENSEIVSGKLNPSSFSREEREERSNKWDSISTLLNSKGLGPQKTAEQWRKSWTDLKCTTRSKAAKLELAGGTYFLNEKLSNLEKRVLHLSGDIAPVEVPEENESKKLTGTLWKKKLEDDLKQTEADLLKAMKKPNQIVLPASFSKLAGISTTVPDIVPVAGASQNVPAKVPIVESIGVADKSEKNKDDNVKDKGVDHDKDIKDDDDDIKDDGDDDDNDDNDQNANYLDLFSDGSDDDINYDDIDAEEEIYNIDLKQPLNRKQFHLAPSKKRKLSTDKPQPKSFISIFQKQIETQTAVLKEQTNVMKDIATSLRLIANALHDR